MPTYSYRCTDCGHAFDARQSFSDEPLTTCPECGGSLRKVFSAAGVVFKGSGFYRTDSRSSSGTSSSSSTSTSSSSASGSGTSGTSSSGTSSTSSSGTSTSGGSAAS